MSQLRRIQRRQSLASTELPHDMPEVLRRVYANRHISTASQLDYAMHNLLAFDTLKDIQPAAQLVANAVMQQQRVMIIGDYDADGATSTALMMRALRLFGLASVHYLVPNRFEFGYGLTPAIVDVAAHSRPELIITVDNGISSIDGVERAREHGMRVLITDHHLAGAQLPRAHAIVNPNQPGCAFPEKSIAGVGVAFYLMLATRAALRAHNWFTTARSEPNMADLLDLVALGTVADVVPLEKNNRLLVQQGLQRIRKHQCCYGIQALLQVAGKEAARCSSQDFGFFVAPRLNAAGRLENMATGIECLLADDMASALQAATLLHTLNDERKHIEAGMLAQAMQQMDKVLATLDENALPPVLCLYDSSWHQGVIGILASRIKERFHRPVIAFADAGNGSAACTEIKGSARSIAGLHIRDVLDAVATRHPGVINKFGGHAMAAGLSIERDVFTRFSQALETEVSRVLCAEALENIVYSDGAIAAVEMNLATAQAIRLAGPWGQQFPEPVFDDIFEVLEWRSVGEKHLKLQLRQPAADTIVDAIAFNYTAADLPAGGSIHAVFRLDVNEFRGQRKLQLIVDYISAG